MRFFLLCLSLLLVYLPSSLGFTTDVYYIETAIADSLLAVDNHELDKLADIYVKNVNIASNIGFPPINDTQVLIAFSKKLFPPELVIQDAITTQRVAFVGPTDENYAFTKATVISYLTGTLFGSGNLTGQVLTTYLRIDDVLTKSSLPGYGGWRIASRNFTGIGTSGNLAIFPPGLSF